MARSTAFAAQTGELRTLLTSIPGSRLAIDHFNSLIHSCGGSMHLGPLWQEPKLCMRNCTAERGGGKLAGGPPAPSAASCIA